MASAEGGSVPSGVRRYGEGCPLPSRVRGLGKRILAYLKATERSFLYLYDKIRGDNSGGLVPCDLRPCLQNKKHFTTFPGRGTSPSLPLPAGAHALRHPQPLKMAEEAG